MNTSARSFSTLVPDEARLEFLPTFFGVKHMLLGEILVYRWMEILCEDYTGGLWDFRTTNTGAMYLALPARVGGMRLAVDGNGYVGTMSTDAAGIVATLFALNELAAKTEDDAIIERYYNLRDFAIDHPEAATIFAAID